MVTAFSAIANGGELMKPYIVDEIHYSDGRIEKTKPKEIREVISHRTAKLVSGMLVQVVDHGYGGRARVPGYFVAGKSGTAQIPGPGGYTEDTNHSFIGFAPGNDPKFVMLVKFEKPKRTYAEVTAAPVFSDIARFALQYFQVPPER
jgi:cell division protein FtsI/penicillin-binding protein 2